jgi:hypothetical protein
MWVIMDLEKSKSLLALRQVVFDQRARATNARPSTSGAKNSPDMGHPDSLLTC